MKTFEINKKDMRFAGTSSNAAVASLCAKKYVLNIAKAVIALANFIIKIISVQLQLMVMSVRYC